jgi:hypothetical protein
VLLDFKNNAIGTIKANNQKSKMGVVSQVKTQVPNISIH